MIRWLEIYISYLAYSQIWRNLPMDDSHFFYIFQWMIATFSTSSNGWFPLWGQTKIPKKNTARELRQIVFYWRIFFKKKRIQNSKFKNKVILEAFNQQTCEKQNGKKYARFLYLAFSVSLNIKRWLKICTFFISQLLDQWNQNYWI